MPLMYRKFPDTDGTWNKRFFPDDDALGDYILWALLKFYYLYNGLN